MRVAALGCGYIGLGLAHTLVADGHDVWGVRRSDDGLDAVEATGAEAVRADTTDANSLGAVPDIDHVIFATSSGGCGADTAQAVLVEGLRTAIDQFAARDSSPKRLVYTSDTGVCGDRDGGFVSKSTPLDPTTGKMRTLAEAKHVARECAAECEIEGTVTWFAGLYSPGHYRLERYLNDPVTTGYLNMIRRGDAVDVVASLLEADRARDDTVLVVGDEPVLKHEFTGWLADECGVPHPEERTKEERLDAGDLSTVARHHILTSKRCSNDYLRELGYPFAYPTYREGYRAAIDAYRVDGDRPYPGDGRFESSKFCHSGQFD